MTIISSREFNQNVSAAQIQALIEPVMITNRGKPSYVLMSYADYLAWQTSKTSPSLTIAQALGDTNPASADIAFEPAPRRSAQRAEVNF